MDDIKRLPASFRALLARIIAWLRLKKPGPSVAIQGGGGPGEEK